MTTVDLVRHVRTPAGHKKYGEPIGAPIIPHPDAPNVKGFKTPGSNARATLSDDEFEKRQTARAVQLLQKRATSKVLTPAESKWLDDYRDRKGASALDQLRATVKAEPKKWSLTSAEVAEQRDVESQLARQLYHEDSTINHIVSQGAPFDDSDEVAKQYVRDAMMQIAAQYYAEAMSHKDPNGDAAVFWEEYQRPDAYANINGSLRDAADFRHAVTSAKVKTMFQQMGYTYAEPTTVHRGILNTRDGEFEVGKPMSDPGLCSTTAQPAFAAGWLATDLKTKRYPTVRTTNPDKDVVLDIELPAGARVVGGMTQFCETILPPDLPLIVKSVEKKHGPAVSAVLGEQLKDVAYTHVVATVDPTYDWTQWYGSSDKRGAEQLDQFANH